VAKETTKTGSANGRTRQTRVRVTTATPRRRTLRATAPHVANGRPTHQEIAVAAYYRFLQRGGKHGFDFDDWIAAERSLNEPAVTTVFDASRPVTGG
jgi:hypothetical protein